MLEKIGLPAKPSLRGGNWVVDASHCQGCSSQFTFINRKHHCRRCGGLFCSSCTQQRMILRGQGDSPVRICEPCKKLEEAARFEMRHGNKSRAGKGGSKLTVKSEDEVLNQILGTDEKGSFSSGLSSNNNMGSSFHRETSYGSSSNTRDGFADISKTDLVNDTASSTPDELRQLASEEKKKYKILKGEGKPEEALKAFKRGKELERQAEALEISIRRSRKRMLSSGSNSETQNKEVSGRNKLVLKAGAEKDDFASELRQLGWSDLDMRDEKKASASNTLEGELSTLFGDISTKTSKDMGTHGIDKAPVIALKRKALMLKREGKLAEAKEELKRAKVLEKQLEEQELLADAEDSDDELAAIIRSMDNDEQDEFLVQYEQEPDFDHLVGPADDIGVDSNFEVTDEDMQDPEIHAALKSLGWTEDVNHGDSISPQSAPLDREVLTREITSLKREALSQKRAGNVAEAMAQLRKAKLLEKDLESCKSLADNLVAQNPEVVHSGSLFQSAELDAENVDYRKDMDPKVAPKSRLMIQKELLNLKKKALALRREGKVDEAEEELKKGKVLEHQLEELDNVSKVKAGGNKKPDFSYKNPVISSELPVGEGEDDVTDQDLHDPAYLSVLRNLGWNDEDNELASHPSKPAQQMDHPSGKVTVSLVSEATSAIPARASRRSKVEIQRDLLGLKRKALVMRRQGKTEEAEEVLNMAKVLEAEMADVDIPKEVQVDSNWPTDRVNECPLESIIEKGGEDSVPEKDMGDPTLLSALKNMTSKDKELEPVTVVQPGVCGVTLRSKGEIQRQLLDLKRKALAHRRKGETEEAEEFLKMAKVLDAQMEELEALKEHPLDSSEVKKSETVESFKTQEKGPCGETGLPTNSGRSEGAAFTSPPTESVNLVDLLTGNNWSSSRVPGEEPEGQWNFALSSTAMSSVQSESLSVPQSQIENPRFRDADLVRGFVSQNNQISVQQDILAHKRKAVTLKREGKLTEARVELGRAKLLEKSLEEDNIQTKISVLDASMSTTKAPSDGQKEHSSSNLAPKPMSARDRFKLQQESLSHKRKALKLRREGRMDEAEAEFEMAKNLEAQLEDLAADDSKSAANEAEVVDEGAVEDLLDPQLLSALKAIGLHDSNMSSQHQERQEPVKISAQKSENLSQERIHLEERIKAEKVKAVNLKRSGKQSEALDALRRAKLFEKKLNSLA